MMMLTVYLESETEREEKVDNGIENGCIATQGNQTNKILLPKSSPGKVAVDEQTSTEVLLHFLSQSARLLCSLLSISSYQKCIEYHHHNHDDHVDDDDEKFSGVARIVYNVSTCIAQSFLCFLVSLPIWLGDWCAFSSSSVLCRQELKTKPEKIQNDGANTTQIHVVLMIELFCFFYGRASPNATQLGCFLLASNKICCSCFFYNMEKQGQLFHVKKRRKWWKANKSKKWDWKGNGKQSLFIFTIIMHTTCIRL